MPFQRHAFISYAHIDNEPLPTETEGWVSLFHAALRQMLAGRLGRQADVWRDDRLRGDDLFANEIVANFGSTAVLVSVLSPRYVKSDWCRREVTEFCRLAESNGGLVVDNKCRVFKVFKLPLDSDADDDALPATLQQVLGYEFYETDEDHTTTRELAPSYGDKSKQDFLRRVAKLAFDIRQLIGKLEGQPPDIAAAVPASTKPTVYLAACAHDRREARELLQLELERMGYTVLPDHPLPTGEAEFVAEVQRLLALSRVSIHLVGSSYGMVPDGPTDKSIPVLQNELAAQRCRSAEPNGELTRLIWLPQGSSSTHPLQAAFIEALHHDAEAQLGADLITGEFETLKAAVHAVLGKLQQPAPAAPLPATPGRLQLHLLCSERDRKEIIPLIKLLRQTMDVTLPVFTGDAAAVREANHALTMACDAVLLYYGAGDEAWKYHQQNELRRIRGLRDAKPLPPEHVYLAAPDSDDKGLLIELGEPRLIDGRAGLPAVVDLQQ